MKAGGVEFFIDLGIERLVGAERNGERIAVYVTLAPYQLSLVDPKDPHSWDLGGFDPSMPKIIQAIANGDL